MRAEAASRPEYDGPKQNARCIEPACSSLPSLIYGKCLSAREWRTACSMFQPKGFSFSSEYEVLERSMLVRGRNIPYLQVRLNFHRPRKRIGVDTWLLRPHVELNQATPRLHCILLVGGTLTTVLLISIDIPASLSCCITCVFEYAPSGYPRIAIYVLVLTSRDQHRGCEFALLARLRPTYASPPRVHRVLMRQLIDVDWVQVKIETGLRELQLKHEVLEKISFTD